MKNVNGLLLKKTQLITTLVFCLLSIPILSFGQKYKLELSRTCVEAIGDGSGRYVVSFGYENTSPETVVVEESSSVVTYNYGQSKKYGTSTFLPGKHEKVITHEFTAGDRVVWEVDMPGDKTKTMSADINSNHCFVTDYITPYYTPPPGGKLQVSKIGTELNALYEKSVLEGSKFKPKSDDIFQIDKSLNVFIEVISTDGEEALLVDQLNSLISGLSDEEDFLDTRATYWFPIRLLIELNHITNFSNLNYARPVFTGINDKIEGQGDKSMRSDYARMGFLGMVDEDDLDNPFNLDGSEVRVGVISNSYDTKGTAYLDVEQGDLPDNVKVLEDITTLAGASLSDEGRAMMQIVHDVAPGAELVFRTGYLGELDMEQGIRDLADPDNPKGNCDIIVDDITYITEPFFRDGIISKAINDVVLNNQVTYISSAGNFGSSSYQDIFEAGSPLPGDIGVPHIFRVDVDGVDDIFQEIELDAGTYTLVLQWDDGTDAEQAITSTDLDIFLSTDYGTSMLGYNRDNTFGAAVEVLPFTVSEDNVSTNIIIVRASGSATHDVAFKYVVFRGGSGFRILEDGQDAGSSTIVGHPNAEGTIAVGAVRYHHTPAYGVEDILVENFSSTGGTPIMTYSSTVGTPEVDFITRVKPDFTAPDGVNTSVNLSSKGGSDYVHDTDTDRLPNFFGTSAAAPHAAGAAALIIQARTKFHGGNNTAPGDIRDLMRSTAIGNDVDDEGNNIHSEVSGYGFIQPYDAIKTFANPKPEIEVLTPPVALANVTDMISFQVKGNFFIEETEISFNGSILPDGVLFEDEQTITVTHPIFVGNPAIQAVNPSISDGPVIDGGASEPIYFSDLPKAKITIKARDVVKKYGESLPSFSPIILTDIPDDPDNVDYNVLITFEDNFIGLSEGELNRIFNRLSIDVKATATSGVANYDINLDFAEPDPSNVLDNAIAEKYDITIKQGYITVYKLPLTITPIDRTIGYGQVLTQNLIKFKYEADPNDIPPEELFAITDALDVQYTNPLPIGVPLVNGITLVRGTALVNNPDGDIIKAEVNAETGAVTLSVKKMGATEFVLWNAGPLPRGIALVNDLPFVQIEEIIDGAGMFNGEEVSIKRIEGQSYVTHLGVDELEEPIAIENGIALVRGTALVNGVDVSVDQYGNLLVNGAPVIGTALVNGVPVIRGTALVNSEHIVRGVALVNQFVRGTALVNEIEIPVFQGIPDVDGNIEYELEAIAMVNGIPLIRGTALVNDLAIEIAENGDILGVGEDAFVNGIAFVRGTALVNGLPKVIGTALVNGGNLVRGVALVNEAPDDNLDYTNMNFLASTNSLDYLNFVNGTALVNGLVGVEGSQVAEAADPLLTNAYTSVRGVALVNGVRLVTGTALVNSLDGVPVKLVTGTALVNDETISSETNGGAIVINHDTEQPTSYIPVTFITGSNAGTHSIVPGTFLSNNFDISYGLGTLTIDPAYLTVEAADTEKTYGQSDLLPYTYAVELINPNGRTLNINGLLGNDDWDGSLVRASGEDAKWGLEYYEIGRGDLSAGPNYDITTFIQGEFRINPKPLTVTATGIDKVYDGTTVAKVELSSDGVEPNDVLYFNYSAALFEDKNAFTNKHIDVSVITLEGTDALNYTANTEAIATAEITPSQFTITPDINGQNHGDDNPSITIKSYELDEKLVEAVTDPEDRDFDGTVADVDLYDGDHLTGSLSYVGSEDVGSYFDAIEQGTLAVTDNNGNIIDGNYDFNILPSWFYINPYGPGTRAIKPVLDCVEDNPVAEIEAQYVANFRYSNDNTEAVYIPAGTVDNMLEGEVIQIFDEYGNDMGLLPPELFLKDGGAIKVYFNGDELRWTINSLDQNHKASNAASANSKSTKCTPNTKSAKVSTAMEEEDPMALEDLMVYPNPVTSKVSLVMKDIENYKSLMLLDMTGKAHPITSIKTRSDRLEIDMSHLTAGSYFFRVIMEDTTRVIQVIKL